MVPPRRKIFTGSGDFLQTGRDFLHYFVEFGHLKPHHRVLDVDSGIGRMAIPLTGYLNHVHVVALTSSHMRAYH